METRTTLDPRGRRVNLTPERWNHIVYGHAYMRTHLGDVIRAIEAPTNWIEEARPGQDWFYIEDAGPSKWLKVVVAYDDKSIGSVKTAFPRRTMP
jgi:hypothetical protein